MRLFWSMLGMISLTAVGNVRTLIAASAEGNGLGYVEEYQPPPAGGTVLEWGGGRGRRPKFRVNFLESISSFFF